MAQKTDVQELIESIKSCPVELCGIDNVKRIIHHYEQQIKELTEQTGQRKPKLPRKLADAIEAARSEGLGDDFVLWRSSRPESREGDDHWKVLYNYVNNNGDIFVLADALRYGYEIEEPTVEEQIKDGLRSIFDDPDCPAMFIEHQQKEKLAERIILQVRKVLAENQPDE